MKICLRNIVSLFCADFHGFSEVKYAWVHVTRLPFHAMPPISINVDCSTINAYRIQLTWVKSRVRPMFSMYKSWLWLIHRIGIAQVHFWSSDFSGEACLPSAFRLLYGIKMQYQPMIYIRKGLSDSFVWLVWIILQSTKRQKKQDTPPFYNR